MWIGFEHSPPPAARLRTALLKTPVAVHIFTPESADIARLAALGEVTASGRSWRISAGPVFPERIDILILTAHGGDFLAPIWNLRRGLPNAVCLVWLFDNHLNYVGNLRTVLAVDGYFPSHAFCADYLLNPHSANFGHLPSSCIQWNEAEIREGLALAGRRADRFLAAFVDYPFSRRHEFLHRLGAIAEANLLLMPPEDRTRYSNKSRAEQLAEWCGHKTSLVVPVERDLSTRLFDALACGQIPLVSDAVLDLGRVFSPAVQAALPILTYRDGDLASLLAAHAEALRRFDAEGETGIRRRHGFVAAGHMLHHRLASMLGALVALDTGRAGIAYHPASAGLVLQALPETAAAPRHSADHPAT
jgi:hypothetical protein